MDIDDEDVLKARAESRLGHRVSDDRWSEIMEGLPHAPWDEADLRELCSLLRDPARKRLAILGRADEESDARFASPEVKRIVRECRQFLFSSASAPHGDLQASAAWIRKRAAEERTQAERTPDFGFGEEVARFAPQLVLEFPGESAVARELVPGLSPLAALGNAARQISEATLCEPYQAVGHILTGMPVRIAPVKVTEVHGLGDTIHPKKVVIQVNFDWVSKQTLADYYDECRQPWGPFDKDSSLRNFARELEGSTQECRRLWNERYPQWAYSTDNSFKTARSRARRRRPHNSD